MVCCWVLQLESTDLSTSSRCLEVLSFQQLQNTDTFTLLNMSFGGQVSPSPNFENISSTNISNFIYPSTTPPKTASILVHQQLRQPQPQLPHCSEQLLLLNRLYLEALPPQLLLHCLVPHPLRNLLSVLGLRLLLLLLQDWAVDYLVHLLPYWRHHLVVRLGHHPLLLVVWDLAHNHSSWEGCLG